MRKVNDLFGKQVINQATGERIAPVRDIVLSADMRQITALVLATGGLFSDDRVVRWPAIISLGDVIVIDGAAPVVAAKEDAEVAELRKQSFQITGAAVINAAGEKIGTVNNIFFDDGGRVLGYEVKQGMLSGLTGNQFLPAENIQTIGKDAVITNGAELLTVREFERALGETHDAIADAPNQID